MLHFSWTFRICTKLATFFRSKLSQFERWAQDYRNALFINFPVEIDYNLKTNTLKVKMQRFLKRKIFQLNRIRWLNSDPVRPPSIFSCLEVPISSSNKHLLMHVRLTNADKSQTPCCSLMDWEIQNNLVVVYEKYSHFRLPFLHVWMNEIWTSKLH